MDLQDAVRTAEQTLEAVSDLKTIVEGESTDTARYLAAGKIFEIENSFPAAEAMYRHALSADPKALEAAARLSVVLLNVDRAEEAKKVISKAIALDPSFCFPSLIMKRPLSLFSIAGDCFRLSGQHHEAAMMYSRASTAERDGRYGLIQAVISLSTVGNLDAVEPLLSDERVQGEFEAIRRVFEQGGDNMGPLVREIAASQSVMGAEQAVI